MQQVQLKNVTDTFEDVLDRGFVLVYTNLGSQKYGTTYLRTRENYPSVLNVTHDLREAAFFDKKEGVIGYCLGIGTQTTPDRIPIITAMRPLAVEVVEISTCNTVSYVSKRKRLPTDEDRCIEPQCAEPKYGDPGFPLFFGDF